MADKLDEVTLPNGTLIRHKVLGYEGQIDGTTEIRACFTARGESLGKSSPGQTFQYRIAVAGEQLRRIAPAEDLSVLESVAAQRERLAKKQSGVRRRLRKKDTATG
jgi:hypothetical protein